MTPAGTGTVNENLHILFALIFVFCVIYALISDFTRLRIPNAVPIVLAVAFGAYALAGGTGNIWPHLALAGLTFILFFAFFALGWVAAGDAKFLPAVMLWAGPAQGMRFILLLAVIGGVFSLGLLGLRFTLNQYPVLAELPVLSKVCRWARNGLCPYGIPISVAALCVAPAIFAGRVLVP